MLIRLILISALIAGILTGALFTAVQQFQVTPLIVEAETYESSASDNHHHADNGNSHSHSHTETPLLDEDNQRLLLSLLANILAGIGFALVVISSIVFSNQTGWRKGLFWGIAGFLVFFAAPSLGLTPKLPGTSGAPLLHQQLWWVATAATTAAGLAMLVFSRSTLLRGVGLLLLTIPHLVGAPQPEQLISSAPDELLQRFVIAASLANAIFWLCLGGLSGYLLRNLDNTSSSIE